MYKTKSGKEKAVFFTNTLLDRMLSHSERDGRGFSWHVREACIKYLASQGIDVSGIENPAGRGVRSDLRSTPTAQKKRDIKELINNDTENAGIAANDGEK
jgi:hypothetical protein